MMATISSNRSKRGGGSCCWTVSGHCKSILLVLGSAVVVLLMITTDQWFRCSLQGTMPATTSTGNYHAVDVTSVGSLRKAQQPSHDERCHWYLAESSIRGSGLGIFAGTGVLPGEMVGFPDICIFVGDAPQHWTHLRSHSYGKGSFFGQYEGNNSRAACEGIPTTFNTQPDRLVNSELSSVVLPTNAGLHRATSPGAGSITHHYGMHAKAKDVITAGSELTIDYGDWDFDEEESKYMEKPERPVPWLQKYGWCIDNIRAGLSTIPHAGRGAFARRTLRGGEVVVPLPLQCFHDRKVFQNTQPEQLYVNYCLQPTDSPMIFYPYGPLFNLVNHAYSPDDPTLKPNVHLQWSSNNLHHATWLDLGYDDFWKVTYPGGLILEVVATRDILPGEEILLDYGNAWEEAWKRHVQQWQPPPDATTYVYPAEMDETEPLRTVQEQQTNPYPPNLQTICNTPDWERDPDRHIIWYEPADWAWYQGMVACHILTREMGDNGNYVYNVSLDYDNYNSHYDESIPLEEQYIDAQVPRRAIRFLERPYMDDEHLPNAFRHPIEFPPHLVPDGWRNTTTATTTASEIGSEG